MGYLRLKPSGPSVFYHVMTRTAQQAFWLNEPEIKEMLLELIFFYSRVYFIDIYAYNVMDNHYHLALEVKQPEFDEAEVKRRFELAQSRLKNPRKFRSALAKRYFKRYCNLSKFMWEINRCMSVMHNKRRKTQGHLWGRRFKSVVVQDDQHLLTLMAYIENNAVRAHMVTDPAAYPYSSLGRMKQAMDRGKKVDTPDIYFLKKFPKEKRAETYMAFIRYAAILDQHKELRNQPLPTCFTPGAGTLDFKQFYDDLSTRAPAAWSYQVYGSESFEINAWKSAGRLKIFKPKRTTQNPDYLDSKNTSSMEQISHQALGERHAAWP